MTKKELIRIIENTYSDDEHLLWQVVSKDDVANYAERGITELEWDAFVDWTERYAVLSDPFTENAVAEFQKYVEQDN